jgi:hypothetical protein
MENDQKPRTIDVTFESLRMGRAVECRIYYLVPPADEAALEEQAQYVSKLPNIEYNQWLSMQLKRHDPVDRKGGRTPAYNVIDMKTRNTIETGYYQNGLLDNPYETIPAHRKLDLDGNEIYRGHYKKGQLLNPRRGVFAEIWRNSETGLVTTAKSYERPLLRYVGGAFFAAAFGTINDASAGINVRAATLAEIAKLNGRNEADEIEMIDALYSPDTDRLVPGHP